MKRIFKITLFFVFILNSIVFSESNVINNTKSSQISYEVLAERLYLREQITSKNIGESILFGSYEQNSILEDGKEPIEWIILNLNDTGNSAILISKYILDCYPFNGFHQNVTWETSSLRNHMNTAMLEEMFDDKELACILPTYLLNSKNVFNGAYSGEPTSDFLFIPGIDEMLAYFSNDYFVNEAKINELTRPNTKRMCYATPYAINRGVRVTGQNDKYPGTANYFLRTTGLNGRRIWFGDVFADYYQSFVSENGSVKPDGTGVNSIDDGIRPMVQICY